VRVDHQLFTAEAVLHNLSRCWNKGVATSSCVITLVMLVCLYS